MIEHYRMLRRCALAMLLAFGFRQAPRVHGIGGLSLHPMIARGLVMGGPQYSGPFPSLPGDIGPWRRPQMEPGEVCRYLNCAPDDLRWLKARGLVVPVNPQRMPTAFDRLEIEALGCRLITTREVAARLGRRPIDMWEPLQRFDEDGALGQGFYRRELVEKWLAEVGLRSLQFS